MPRMSWKYENASSLTFESGTFDVTLDKAATTIIVPIATMASAAGRMPTTATAARITPVGNASITTNDAFHTDDVTDTDTGSICTDTGLCINI